MIHLCVMLWPNPGAAAALVEYEDKVLDLLATHGGRVLQRARTDGANDAPLEIHVLEFPSQAALDDYLGDERRTVFADARETAIARTEVFSVDLI